MLNDLATARVDSWRVIWRRALAPQCSTVSLRSLARALERDDPNVLQGVTTFPIEQGSTREEPCEAACPIAWLGMASGLRTVGEVYDFFARTLFEADQLLGAADAHRPFLAFADYSARPDFLGGLLAEVEAELERRGEGAHA